MGQNLRELVKELQSDQVYPTLFAEAFGRDTVHVAFVARALAQYLRTLISADSRYDRFVRAEAGGELSPLEKQGMQLAQEKCAACHAFTPGESDFFTDYSYHNNGLDSLYAAGEEGLFLGRFRITADSSDMGAYKTPSLRNLPQSAPYMHDGRFASLEEVLAHYSSGVHTSAYLDPLLVGPDGKPGIPLSKHEKDAIIAFLYTLQSE
jgi:cytochrome c peroxidase